MVADGTSPSGTRVNGGGQAATLQPGDVVRVVQVPSPAVPQLALTLTNIVAITDPAAQRAVQGPNSLSVESACVATRRDPGSHDMDRVGDVPGGVSADTPPESSVQPDRSSDRGLGDAWLEALDTYFQEGCVTE